MEAQGAPDAALDVRFRHDEKDPARFTVTVSAAPDGSGNLAISIGQVTLPAATVTSGALFAR